MCASSAYDNVRSNKLDNVIVNPITNIIAFLNHIVGNHINNIVVVLHCITTQIININDITIIIYNTVPVTIFTLDNHQHSKIFIVIHFVRNIFTFIHRHQPQHIIVQQSFSNYVDILITVIAFSNIIIMQIFCFVKI